MLITVPPENDAMLATLYAMMFACSYAGDSIYDFFLLGRAVGTATQRLGQLPNSSSVLVGGTGQASSDLIIAVKEKLQPHRIDQKPVSGALASLAQLHCLTMDETETKLYGMLLHTAEMLKSYDIGGELE